MGSAICGLAGCGLSCDGYEPVVGMTVQALALEWAWGGLVMAWAFFLGMGWTLLGLAMARLLRFVLRLSDNGLSAGRPLCWY
jgi:hypothetical protein